MTIDIYHLWEVLHNLLLIRVDIVRPQELHQFVFIELLPCILWVFAEDWAEYLLELGQVFQHFWHLEEHAVHILWCEGKNHDNDGVQVQLGRDEILRRLQAGQVLRAELFQASRRVCAIHALPVKRVILVQCEDLLTELVPVEAAKAPEKWLVQYVLLYPQPAQIARINEHVLVEDACNALD